MALGIIGIGLGIRGVAKAVTGVTGLVGLVKDFKQRMK